MFVIFSRSVNESLCLSSVSLFFPPSLPLFFSLSLSLSLPVAYLLFFFLIFKVLTWTFVKGNDVDGWGTWRVHVPFTSCILRVVLKRYRFVIISAVFLCLFLMDYKVTDSDCYFGVGRMVNVKELGLGKGFWGMGMIYLFCDQR